MSEEQLKALQDALKTDATLREKLKAAGNADAVVAIAKAAGFMIHAEELGNGIQELSDEELEAVAGGNKNECWTICIFSECISVE